MPPSRAEGFLLDDPDDPMCLICDICSRWLNPQKPVTKSLLRTGKVNHLKSARHQKATENMKKTNLTHFQPIAVNEPSIGLPYPAELPSMNIKTKITDVYRPPLPDLFVNSRNGQYFGSKGKQIQFSAGKTTKKQTDLTKQTENPPLSLSPDIMDINQSTSFEASVTMKVDATDILFKHIEMDEASEWFPYSSQTMFLLDYLDNLPRLRLSDDHLKVILWIMKECGTPDVPTFSALRKIQRQLHEGSGLMPSLHTSSLDNYFYMSQPAKLLSLDWGNPHVRPLMNLYPEVADVVTESWQAKKWVSESVIDDDAPMWADWENPAKSHRQYFVHELATTCDRKTVLILKWLLVNGEMSVDVSDVSKDEQRNMFTIEPQDPRRIPASSLQYNILDMMKNFNVHFSCDTMSTKYPQPSPLRDLGKGKPMFRMRVMVWSDDVSGNKSKQYNQHTNVCIINLNVPHRVSSQEYFVRFCSTSQHASSSEQLAALVEDFDRKIWHTAYDCKLQSMIMFQIVPHILPGDNPQQSETASHIGVKGNHNSRRDAVGGSEREKERAEVYLKLHQAVDNEGAPNAEDVRSVEDTIAVIKSQLKVACRGDSKLIADKATETGVKDKIAQHWISKLLDMAKSRKEEKIKAGNVRLKDDKARVIQEVEEELWSWLIERPDGEKGADVRSGVHYNALLETRGINVHTDTPIEILHTYLLGNDKYVWHYTWNNWSKRDGDTIFANRLQSANVDGLTSMVPRAHYMIRFKNNLIGKHFRCLQELAVFQLYDLVDSNLLALWCATGELGALLYYPEIRNMGEYLADLQVLIDNLLDAWGQVDPRRIISKIKLRLMPYLVQDIRRFGPALLYATEIFESYNAIFRSSSILSNRHAPSLDIATDLAGIERFKHLISGGWWFSAENQHFVQAGSAIRDMFEQNDEFRRRVGWNITRSPEPGTVTIRKTHSRELSGTTLVAETHLAEPYSLRISPNCWLIAESVVSQSKDTCKEQSWVFFLNSKGTNSIGRILRIVQSSDTSSRRVIIRVFNLNGNRDARLNMPILMPSDDGTVAVEPTAIIFLFNAQHDCYTARCSLTSDSGKFFEQERIKTTIPKTTVSHAPVERYIINMHALHNAHLLRYALPRALTHPIHLHQDRQEVRKALSDTLCVTGEAKRGATKAKAAQTRLFKKDLRVVQDRLAAQHSELRPQGQVM